MTIIASTITSIPAFAALLSIIRNTIAKGSLKETVATIEEEMTSRMLKKIIHPFFLVPHIGILSARHPNRNFIYQGNIVSIMYIPFFPGPISY